MSGHAAPPTLAFSHSRRNSVLTVADPDPCDALEIIDSAELARRLSVSKRWIEDNTRVGREPIPHMRFGRFVRYEWASPALNEWLANRRRT